MPSEFLDLTKIVSNQLFQLGYNPYSISKKENTNNPDKFEYILDYDIRAWQNHIDDFGNVLIKFICHGWDRIEIEPGPNYSWTIKFGIGVWNKDYGFKVINIREIEGIQQVCIKEEYLLVKGFDLDEDKHLQGRIAIISIKDGYWREQEKENLENSQKNR